MYDEIFYEGEDPQIAFYEEMIDTLRNSLNHVRGDQEATVKLKKEIREKRKYIRKLKKEKGIR